MANGFLTSSPTVRHGDMETTPPANICEAQKYTCPGTGLQAISEIGLWCDAEGSTANFKLSIWTHDATNNVPEALVSNSETPELTQTGGTVSKVYYPYTTKPILTGGEVYWLVWYTKDANLGPDKPTGGGGTGRYTDGSLSGPTYPTNPTGAQWEDCETYNEDTGIYAVYGPAGIYEQEGFRFRNDNGDEDGATWKAAQDVNISAGKGYPVRLRTLIDLAGDMELINLWAYYWAWYGGTPVTINKPVDTAEGDLLVALVYAEGTSVGAISAPGGWTQDYAGTSGTSRRGAVFSKVAGASEASSYDFSATNASLVYGVIFRVGDYGTPYFDTAIFEYQTGASQTFDFPQLTQTKDGSIIFYLCLPYYVSGNEVSFTRGDNLAAGNDGMGITWEQDTSAGTTALQTGTFTYSIDNFSSIVAIYKGGKYATIQERMVGDPDSEWRTIN